MSLKEEKEGGGGVKRGKVLKFIINVLKWKSMKMYFKIRNSTMYI